MSGLVSLDDLAMKIREAYAGLMETATERALKVGRLLLEAKKHVSEGKWETWLAANVPFGVRSAQRFMQLTRAPKLHATSLSFLANNEAKTIEKKEARAAREAELGAAQMALPNKKYGLIYSDPEWRFDVWSRETGMDRAADNHYPTSGIEAIIERDVASIAADDCMLFLWATVPMLPQALRVMCAWGFEYRSHFVWAKDKIGTGYWNRNKHELLLIGVRGNIPAPAMGTQAASLIEAPVGKHSAKPEKFLEIIESYFPSLPKIELNRRGSPRPGWDAWGNEIEEAAE